MSYTLLGNMPLLITKEARHNGLAQQRKRLVD